MARRDYFTNTESDAGRYERFAACEDTPRYAGVRSVEEIPSRAEAEADVYANGDRQ